MTVEIRSGLLAAVTAVREYLIENQVDANVEVGWKRRRRQVNQVSTGANRIVFIPSTDERGDGGSLESPMFPGNRRIGEDQLTTIRPLLDWDRSIQISVWAIDNEDRENEAAQIEATETLFEWVVRAIHGCPGAFASLTWGATKWTPPEERSFGLELRVNLTFRHPVFDLPRVLIVPDSLSLTKNSVVDPTVPPTLVAIIPATIAPGSGIIPLLLSGTGFDRYGSVSVDGIDRNSVWIDSNTVAVYVDFGGLALGPHSVVYRTYAGVSTAPASFSVASGGSNPSPTLSSLNISSATATASDVAIVASGSNFLLDSIVYAGSVPLPTTFVNTTTLNFNLTGYLASVVGSYSITVRNSAPGGGTSGSLPFTINARVPTLSSINPVSATKNAVGVVVTCTGTNYGTDSVARVDGVSYPTTFVNSTTVTFVAPTSVMGAKSITVQSTGPGGGISGSQTFTINYALNCDGPARVYNGGDWLTSGSNITQWNDSSGNAAHAVQATVANQPTVSTLNGKPAALANNKAMSIASSIDVGPYTILIVRQLVAVPGAGVTICVVNLKTGGKVFSEFGFSGNVAGGFPTHYAVGGLAGGGGAVATIGHNAAQDTSRHIDIMTYDAGDPIVTSEYSMSRDGVAQTVVTSGTISPTASNLQSILGRLLSGNTTNGAGNLLCSLIMIWTRKLTPTEIADAYAFVNANY